MSEYLKFKHNINNMSMFRRSSEMVVSSIKALMKSRDLSERKDPHAYFESMWCLAYIEQSMGNFDQACVSASRMLELSKDVGYEMPNEMWIEYESVKAYSMSARMMCDPYKFSAQYVNTLCDLNANIFNRSKNYSAGVDKAIAMALFAGASNTLNSKDDRDFYLEKAKSQMIVVLHTLKSLLEIDEFNHRLPSSDAVPDSWKKFVYELKSSASPEMLMKQLPIVKH